jgi:hypothetical protein
VEFSFLSSDRKKYVIAESALSTPYPTSHWRRAEVVGAAYRFRVPAVAPAGDYPLMVNVLDPDSGESVGPAITLAKVTVKAQERNFEYPRSDPVSAFLNEIERWVTNLTVTVPRLLIETLLAVRRLLPIIQFLSTRLVRIMIEGTESAPQVAPPAAGYPARLLRSLGYSWRCPT